MIFKIINYHIDKIFITFPVSSVDWNRNIYFEGRWDMVGWGDFFDRARKISTVRVEGEWIFGERLLATWTIRMHIPFRPDSEGSRNRMALPFLLDAAGRSGGSNLAIDKSPRNEEVGHMKNLEIHFVIYASACSPRCRDTRACGTRLSFFLGWIPARLPLLFEFLPSSSPPSPSLDLILRREREKNYHIFFNR